MRIHLLLAVMLALPSMAQAGPRKKQVHRRQARQEERIHQGVKSGELTKEEAVGLQKEEHAIRQERRKAMSDGKMTPEEQKKINEMENKASNDIYNEKHDAEKQPAAQ